MADSRSPGSFRPLTLGCRLAFVTSPCVQRHTQWLGSLFRPLFPGGSPWKQAWFWLSSADFLQQSLSLRWLARFCVYSGKNWSKRLLHNLFPEVWNIQWNFLKLWLHDVFFFFFRKLLFENNVFLYQEIVILNDIENFPIPLFFF